MDTKRRFGQWAISLVATVIAVYVVKANPSLSPTDCQIGNGASYRGTVSVTRTGKTCQHWDSQTPHEHVVTPANNPASGLEQNYCRNPDGDPSGVWCITTDSERPWDYCDVPTCSGHGEREVCYEDEFQCLNGSCIPDNYWCDGEVNCLQGEDESICGAGSCQQSDRQCLNGWCIPEHYWCDGQYNDCLQGEDESDCEAVGCQESERQCLDGWCIPEHYWCNGYSSCSQGEDESDCGAVGCQESAHQCFDGSCIPEHYWCNGHSDCSQGEDESDCPWWMESSPAWAIDATPTLSPDTSGPDKVLDSDVGTFWNPISPGPWYIIFDLLVAHTLSKIRITSYGNMTHDVTAFELQISASSDPYNWIHVIESPYNMPVDLALGGFSATSRFWQLLITATGPDNQQPWLVEVSFLGMAADCLTGNGTSYRGNISMTETGRTCQHWDSQTPHQHDVTSANYPASGLEQNYCRNPDGGPSGVWCFTIDPEQQWGYCDVPACFAGGCVRRCLDGLCIPEDNWCDGYIHCWYGDDESDCGAVGCQESERQCLDGSCIPEHYWCDGEYTDCSEGEDESDCLGELLSSALGK
ncbi:plasminogen-like [Branchiostoma floridae]|uniref:Plasminogen-like n=1 Tax=Branchiostoma floridae TaxID=7739 RepID=A0A9J7MZ16_BRAFL|nr:plasminogen-like [Branchiostoma floridae]